MEESSGRVARNAHCGRVRDAMNEGMATLKFRSPGLTETGDPPRDQSGKPDNRIMRSPVVANLAESVRLLTPQPNPVPVGVKDTSDEHNSFGARRWILLKHCTGEI